MFLDISNQYSLKYFESNDRLIQINKKKLVKKYFGLVDKVKSWIQASGTSDWEIRG